MNKIEKVVIATNNEGKVKEFKRLFKDWGIPVYSLKEMEIEIEIEETGKTFQENAELKCREIYKRANCAVIGDDSGLEVEALGGAPGVRTGRYSGEEGDNEKNIQKLLKNMEKEDNRKGKFVCVLGLQTGENELKFFTGECAGEITRKKEGEKGFGYDPVFSVNGVSFGKMSLEEKNKLSHRGKAMEQLEHYIKKEMN